MKMMTRTFGWLCLLMLGLGPAAASAAQSATTSTLEGNKNMVYVRLIGPDGKLSEPVVTPKVTHSDVEWQKILTPEQYKIMRTKGTEAAFCGGLLNNKEAGVYVCAGCNLPLFKSSAKFESGTGWPSFFE